MICIHCATELPDHASFCTSCGQQLARGANPSAPPAHDTVPTAPLPPAPMDSGQPPVEHNSMLEKTLQGSEIPTALSPTPPPGQLSFIEQPLLWQQYDLPAPQLWEAFGPGGSAEQPGDEASPQIFQASGLQPPLFIESEVVTSPLPRASTSRFRVLAKPLPIWTWLIGIAIVVLILGVLQLRGTDWANGAMQGGIAAGVIGGLIALGTGVRALAGMRGLKKFVSVGITVVILLAYSAVGITQQSSIHRLQGNYLEGKQQWQAAIIEYQLAGEGSPTSTDISRTYDEWGEQLSGAQHYEAAIAKFDIVVNSYSSARTEVIRAQADEIKAYLAWGKEALQQQNYSAATMHLDALLSLPYCDSSCQAQGSALDATAYYNLAESSLAVGQYSDAVNFFQTVTTRFASSPEAQKLHGDFAKALLGEGQQQVVNSCSSAIPTYEELSTQFADTSQGQEAKKALAAPQPVKGRFTSFIPRSSTLTPVVVLAKNLYGGMPADQFLRAINGAPLAVIQQDGIFTFKPLRQGTYDLVWGTLRSDGAFSFTLVSYVTTSAPVYVATVGPLCPFDFTDINENIPTPQ